MQSTVSMHVFVMFGGGYRPIQTVEMDALFSLKCAGHYVMNKDFPYK